MPVTKSAKKKLRKDNKREKENLKLRVSLKKAVKKATLNSSVGNFQNATKVIDKAVKKHLIHTNKAARLKSRLSKLPNAKTPAKSSKK